MARIVSPVDGIFDTDTGRLIGFTAPGAGAAESALIPSLSLTDAELSAFRVNGKPARVAKATAQLWFPFSERQASTLTDAGGTLQGGIKGGSTLRWGVNPGMTFNGSNHRVECNTSLANAPQYSSARIPPGNGFTHAVSQLADLASLPAAGDMILAWAVFSHDTPIAADMVLAGFGMNADPDGKGGWAFGIKAGTPGKVQFWHRGVGGASTDVAIMPMDGVTGKANDNTRTAIALEIAAGLDGYLEVRSYMSTLGTEGGASQNNVGCMSPLLLTGGATSAVKGDLLNDPLMLGAWTDAVPFSRNSPAGTIGTGAANNFTASADFGAPGPQGTTLPFNQGIWLWFGPRASTPALTAKPYWVEFSTLRVGTIFSNGPGSAPINFTAGVAAPVITPTRINHFKGSIQQIGLQRRPHDAGLGMRVVRDLRDSMLAFPRTLAV